MKKNLFKMIVLISCVLPTYTYADTNLKLAREAVKEWYQSISGIVAEAFDDLNNRPKGDELSVNTPALPTLLYYENCKPEDASFDERTQVVTTAVAKYLSKELSKNIDPAQLWGHIKKDYCPNDSGKPISLDALKESIVQTLFTIKN